MLMGAAVQVRRGSPLMSSAACVAMFSIAGIWAGQPPPADIAVRVVDATGKPAAGVQVGAYGAIHPAEPDKGMSLYFGGENRDPVVTGEDGGVTVARSTLFHNGDYPAPLIAWDAETRTMAVVPLKPGEEGPVELRLAPAIPVEVTITCDAMAETGLTLDWTYMYVYAGETRPLSVGPGQGVHRLLLPPGEYLLHAYGRETYIARPRLVVSAEDPEVRMKVDAPLGRLPRLIGKPAPELTSIKAWKNGGPATLADFRGKIVLLDFWGYWCGPCVHEMPALMDLHDKYKDRGLVIIGVHDDSAASIEEMDKELAEARKDLWKGRDLPFLIALDGGGDTLIEGTDLKSRGATTAAYGVRSFPTTVLIDRDGRLVSRFRPRSNEDVEKLEKLLGE